MLQKSQSPNRERELATIDKYATGTHTQTGWPANHDGNQNDDDRIHIKKNHDQRRSDAARTHDWPCLTRTANI